MLSGITRKSKSLSGLAQFQNFTRRAMSSQTKSGKHPIVDVWAQPPVQSHLKLVPEVMRLLEQSKAPLSMLKDVEKMGPDGLVSVLDMAGISKVFMSAWSRPGMFPITNEQVYKYTCAYPDRFIGLGAVTLNRPLQAVDEIEKCIKEYKFKGIRILPWIWNMPPTTNYFYPLFATMCKLDVPFCTQVGHTGPLCPSEPGRPVPYIDQIALDFPDLKIIGGHIGYPWTNEMIGCAWKHKNVYIDTSAHAPKYYPKELVQFMDSYGSEKVMFGTNFPQLQWGQCAEQALKLPLKADNLENFLWRNANKVFKLDMENGNTLSSKL